MDDTSFEHAFTVGWSLDRSIRTLSGPDDHLVERVTMDVYGGVMTMGEVCESRVM